MDQLVLFVGLMLATVLLVGVGERIGRPYPVLMTLLGLTIAVVPGLPQLRIDPELILPLFLPPLIYATAQRTSWPMFKARWRGVVLLAVVLVLITVATVAATVWALIPGVTVAAAIALGALVAPPDPVAAEAVAGPLRMPRRLITLLESEGLFNDATALVVYQVAVATAVSGNYSLPEAVLRFGYAAGGALVIGLAIGWLTRWLLAHLNDTTARNALTLVVPFATYLLADHVQASGVIAVVVVALYLGQNRSEDAVADRLSGGAFWEVVELLATGLAFGLIGLELRDVIESGAVAIGDIAGPALLVCLVVVAVRALWMLAGIRLQRLTSRDDPDRAPVDWREALVLTWCGMRGLATLALALALPLTVHSGATFPARSQLLLIACAVIVVTLVLPGMTLPPLVRALGVQGSADAEHQAERALAARAYRAALKRLRDLDVLENLPDDVIDAVRERYKPLVAVLGGEPIPEEYQQRLTERRNLVNQIRTVRAEMLAAARQEVLDARATPGTDPAIADRVLRRLDLEAASLS